MEMITPGMLSDLADFAHLHLPVLFPRAIFLAVRFANFADQEAWPETRSALQTLARSNPRLRLWIDGDCEITTEQLSELRGYFSTVLWGNETGVQADKSSSDTQEKEETIVGAEIGDYDNKDCKSVRPGKGLFGSAECESDSAEESDKDDLESDESDGWCWEYETDVE